MQKLRFWSILTGIEMHLWNVRKCLYCSSALFLFFISHYLSLCRASKVTEYCVFLQKTSLVPTMLLSGAWSIAQKWMSWWQAAGTKQWNSGIPELPVMQEPSPSLKRYVLHSRCQIMHPGPETSHRTLPWAELVKLWAELVKLGVGFVKLCFIFFLTGWKYSILKDWYSEYIAIFGWRLWAFLTIT